MDRLSLIEQTWEEIESSFRIAPFESPLNWLEEREHVITAFKRGESYNPQFQYKDIPKFPVDRIQRFIAELEISDSDIERLYLQKARFQLLQIESIQSRSPDTITATTALMYGLPSKELVTEASRLLSTVSEQDDIELSEDVSTDEAVALVLQELERLNIVGWSVVTSSLMNAKISVNRKDKEIKIREGTMFSRRDLHRLLVHEIGVHVLRFENGTQQPVRLFSTAFPKYLATEEGLAVYCEDKSGLLLNSTLRKYACRVLGAQLALHKSFFEAFCELTNHVGLEEAFEIMLRAKRGFRDTGQYGGNMKDIVYLKGFIQIRKHLETNPTDFPLLFAGKFGLKNLPLVRSLMIEGILNPADRLPQLAGEQYS